MPNQLLPKKIQSRYNIKTVDEMWYKMLTEGDPMERKWRHIFGLIPASPRCAACHTPFGGIGGVLGRLGIGMSRQSVKNPRFCDACWTFTSTYTGGAEVELTMLFVDVRGSTTIAERMTTVDFSHLMNRFYEAVIHVLVHADAFIDKLVGDEVTALFIPGYAGPQHASRAVQAGQELLKVTGHADPSGPWVPVGVGIHTGPVWVGSVVGATGAGSDFTGLGDNVNITARLASIAGPGEILVSEAARNAAGLQAGGLEKRVLVLKGKSEPVHVIVLHE